MELILHEYELPLKHPFTISRGTTTAQRTLIVELQQDGVSGYGEAIANTYYDSPMDSMRARLQSVQTMLGGETFRDTESFWKLCAERLADASFVLSALDCAAHDLWGRLEGAPVHRLWGLDPADAVNSSYTIGIAGVDKMVPSSPRCRDGRCTKSSSAPRTTWKSSKPCASTPRPCFASMPTAAGLRDEAATLSAEMARHGVEFIEQPLPPEAREAQAQLFRDSALPIIADENCVGEADVPLCVDHFHGINIKLCKCGGLTPARRMIATARDHGLKVMVGCMTESSVGISAAAQLTPLLDYADLDGAVLLAKDAADGVQLHQGQFVFPSEPGLGIRTLK